MIESAQHHPAQQNPVKEAEGWKGQICINSVDKLQEWMTKKRESEPDHLLQLPNRKISLDILGVKLGS